VPCYVTTGVSDSVSGAGGVHRKANLDIDAFLKEMICCAEFLHKRGRTDVELELGLEPDVIKMGATIDGAKLTAQSGMILFCLKLVDSEMLQHLEMSRQHDSIGNEGKDLLDNIDELQNYVNVQSTKNVLLCGWMEGKDNTENNFALSKCHFEYLERFNSHSTYLYVPRLGKHFRLYFVFPMDLKAHWTHLGIGAGSHIAEDFCCFCGFLLVT